MTGKKRQNRKRVTFTLDASLLQELDDQLTGKKHSPLEGLKRSTVIERALQQYLFDNDQEGEAT